MDKKKKKTTGRRIGCLWHEDDGTVKTLHQKAKEENGCLPPEAPTNRGSKAFQEAAEEYCRLLFGDEMVDRVLEEEKEREAAQKNQKVTSFTSQRS